MTIKLPLPRRIDSEGYNVVEAPDVAALEAEYERALKVVETVKAYANCYLPGQVLDALREFDAGREEK
jgi:hypothetical protein